MLLTVFGNHPDVSRAMLLQAFSSRLAIGCAGGKRLAWNGPDLGGRIGRILISLPDAFALHSYAGVLGTGVVFGAIAGWVSKTVGQTI